MSRADHSVKSFSVHLQFGNKRRLPARKSRLYLSKTLGQGQHADYLHLREDALMKASNNVTEALQRTVVLMQKELEQSVLSAQLLGS